MKKSSFIILIITVFILAVTATILASCGKAFESQESSKDFYLPEADGDRIITILPDDSISAPGEDIYECVENELPPESFVGTVVEEDTHFMVVAPNMDEMEYSAYGKYLRVEYLHDHIDYLYGIGRKVVITYIPPVVGGTTITTDDIRHDGFEEFKLSVQYREDSIPARFAQIQYAGFLKQIANNRDFDENASDYNLYNYGLHDVYVTVDGDTLPLIEALKYGKVTIDGIIAECNRLSSIGEIQSEQYKDGGSILFDFGDFKILKYHTIEGNRDVYIGTSDMNINAVNATSLCITGTGWKDWGLRLEARDVTPEGATVVFRQVGGNTSGETRGNVSGELQTGEAFYLEKLVGNKWVGCETNPLIDYAFNLVAYKINKDGETEMKTDWEWLYGALTAGQYRLSKSVMDFRKTADYDEQIYYAYFEIPENFANE